MKNLIYQCYDGDLLPGHHASIANMRQYADSIGAEYVFKHNPKFGAKTLPGIKWAYFYDAIMPVYDKTFHEYDNVLSVDIDFFVVDGIKESIFDGFSAEVGCCTEPLQPLLRANSKSSISSKSDNKWAAHVKNKWGVDVPRTEDGLVKIYNAGLVLWSKRGMVKAQERFVPIIDYVNSIKPLKIHAHYSHDQLFLHAMYTVAKMDHVELDNKWNCLIHKYYDDTGKLKLSDPRNTDTKFVHIQLRSADHWDADTQWRITNLPVSEWKLP